MEAPSSSTEILNRDYSGMAISVTKNAKGKHEYNAHYGSVFKFNESDPDAREIDIRYPVNFCTLNSLLEIEAWIDGYHQGTSDNR